MAGISWGIYLFHGKRRREGPNYRIKIPRTALQNAASIAGLMITNEAMVAEAPER